MNLFSIILISIAAIGILICLFVIFLPNSDKINEDNNSKEDNENKQQRKELSPVAFSIMCIASIILGAYRGIFGIIFVLACSLAGWAFDVYKGKQIVYFSALATMSWLLWVFYYYDKVLPKILSNFLLQFN